MAYNNYVNPYNPYLNALQQPQRQQPVQQGSYELPIQNIMFLNADQIKGHIVFPNTKEMLIDKENKLAYIETTDNLGNFSVKKYKFEEVVGNDDKGQNFNDVTYVKQDELKDFVKIDALQSFSDQISKKLETLEKKIKISEILGGKADGTGKESDT